MTLGEKKKKKKKDYSCYFRAHHTILHWCLMQLSSKAGPVWKQIQILEYSSENEWLSKTSNAFKAALKQNPVHKRVFVVKINQTTSTTWIKTTVNEHSGPCLWKPPPKGGEPHQHAPLWDLGSSSNWCPQRAILHRQNVCGGKVSKMQSLSLGPPQSINLSTSKLRKFSRIAKKFENRNGLKGT